jgi:hypothetical protein
MKWFLMKVCAECQVSALKHVTLLQYLEAVSTGHCYYIAYSSLHYLHSKELLMPESRYLDE